MQSISIGIEVLAFGPELLLTSRQIQVLGLVLGIDLKQSRVLVLVLGIDLKQFRVLILELGIDLGPLEVLVLVLTFSKLVLPTSDLIPINSVPCLYTKGLDTRYLFLDDVFFTGIVRIDSTYFWGNGCRSLMVVKIWSSTMSIPGNQ